MIFCDTSYAAKLYVPEADSAVVREHLEGYTGEVCLSELARAELLAVFHRRLREGRWSLAEFSAAARQFQQDDLSGFWTWLPLDSVITQATAQLYLTLPPGVFLRTGDGLHLVTARHHGFTEIYTCDRHQTLAAPALGLRARNQPV
ncbi:MAG: type II toxin-antitoxin system VapC family toxin [Verrucomicrobia bacterium]|nr:type II toxin-antitoxin system VapC family toxin [Verrucomicrobiota bacterium]